MFAAAGLDVITIVIGIAGGLAIFLLGMELMTDALKLIAGESLKRVLARLTTDRFRAALTGIFVTAVIQSSTVTTVLVVGFVSAGLLSLAQAIGIIMGANVGTTITAQVIAFKVTKQALAVIAFGFVASLFTRRPAVAQAGRALLGLGLIFLGMNLIAESTMPLREHEGFALFLARLENPYAALGAAALFTAVIQASAATTGIVIVLAGHGMIGLESAIALILGANVGTCITAFLAAAKAKAEARRAALAHILFNVVGAAIWLPFVPEAATIVRRISPHHDDLEGLARIAAEAPRQIANAHGLFNVVNLVLFIGFTRPLAALLERVIRGEKEPDRISARFLDPILLATPAIALERVKLELAHLARVVREFAASFPSAVAAGPRAVRELTQRDDDIDRLHTSLLNYLGKLSAFDLKPKEVALLGLYVEAGNYLEQIGDTLATNGISVASSLAVNREAITGSELAPAVAKLGRAVDESMAELLQLLDDDDVEAGRNVVRRKTEIVDLMHRASHDLMLRLRMGGEERIRVYRAEQDLLDLQRRVFYLVRRIAKTMLEARRVSAGETKKEIVDDAR